MFEIKNIGQSQEPVVIIEDFHPDFEKLRALAKACHFEKLAEFYPGIQAAADPGHLQPVAELLTRIFKEAFGIHKGVSLVQCAYSLVTTPEEELSPIQRLPHIDTTDPGRIALLHYLSGPESGGTAFYRHRKTQFEVLSDENYLNYKTSLQNEGIPKDGYMRGSDDRFEMIENIAAKQNRAILYRSAILHSGHIPVDANFSKNPESGRLTLNSFFQSRD
jgi:hypothetical protein